jgi:hypothetical protein
MNESEMARIDNSTVAEVSGELRKIAEETINKIREIPSDEPSGGVFDGGIALIEVSVEVEIAEHRTIKVKLKVAIEKGIKAMAQEPVDALNAPVS